MSNNKLNTNSSKKVLMIAQSNFNYDARIIRFCDMLKLDGIDVDIICLRRPEQEKNDKIENVSVYRIMDHFNQDTIFSYTLNSFIFLFKALFKSIQLSKKRNYLFVHVHNMPDFLVFAAFYFKLKKTKIILDIHDLVVELFKEKWNNHNKKVIIKIIEFVEKISVRFADDVITVSNECAQRLQDRGLQKNKLKVIMNVPNLKHFPFYEEKKFDYNSFNVIYHGTIAERYGLHHAIQSIAYAAEFIPILKFYIVGNSKTEYGTQLKNLAKKFGVEDKIIFHEPIHYNQLSEFFKTMDLGLITETTIGYSEFGTPTKAFEYAASGIPIIINDLSVNRSVFSNESVVFIDYSDYKHIAEKIVYLYNNPSIRFQMAQNAFKDLLKVSYEKMRERYRYFFNGFTYKENGDNLNVQSNTYTGSTYR